MPLVQASPAEARHSVLLAQLAPFDFFATHWFVDQ